MVHIQKIDKAWFFILDLARNPLSACYWLQDPIPILKILLKNGVSSSKQHDVNAIEILLRSPLCFPSKLPQAIEILIENGFSIPKEKSEDLLANQENSFEWYHPNYSIYSEPSSFHFKFEPVFKNRFESSKSWSLSAHPVWGDYFRF